MAEPAHRYFIWQEIKQEEIILTGNPIKYMGLKFYKKPNEGDNITRQDAFLAMT
jgi:hypothetical protein